jgi:thiol-disulfide isomerase/thioredoxin
MYLGLTVYSLLTAPLFTFIVYNIGLPGRTTQYFVSFLLFLFSYLLAKRIFKKNKWETYAIIILPAILIDATVLVGGQTLIPLRFPFATLFSVSGALLGLLITERKRMPVIIMAVAAAVFFLCSHFVFIPRITMQMLKRNTLRQSVKDISSFFEMTLVDKEGKKLLLKDTLGRLSLIDFYFVGCPPCEAKIPSMEKIAEEFAADNYRTILICNGEASSFSDFQKHLSRKQSKLFIFLYDPQAAMEKKMGINSFPHEFILHQGKIIAQLKGFNDEAAAQYEKQTIEKIKTALRETK